MKSKSKIFTLKRPRIYYFEIIDCRGRVKDSFQHGVTPRVTHEIHMTTGTDANEFSYEDMGSIQLYSILAIIQIVLFVLIIRTFKKFLVMFK